MKALVLKALIDSGEETTRNISPVIDPDSVVFTNDTIIDKTIQKHGGVVELTQNIIDIFGREITSIALPPVIHKQVEGMIVLNQLAVCFNNVLRINEQVKEKITDAKYLATSVKRYQGLLIRLLSGKQGYLNRFCLTSRTTNTIRAVALPNASWSPEWIGIPGHIMEKCQKKHGALCMVVRFPDIWDGSLEVMRARKTNHDCIEIHPLLNKQFGLDFDGDTMSVFWIPDILECQQEAEKRVISFLRHRSIPKWPGVFGENPGMPNLEHMAQVVKDMKTRLPLSGFSISPEDILEGNNSPSIQRLENITGKKLGDKNKALACHISKKEYVDKTLQVNMANMVMKTYLGPVGAITRQIKNICLDTNELIQNSSMDLTERIMQSLLDSKHLNDDISEENFMLIIDVMNKKYPHTRFAMPSKIIDILESLGVSEDICGPCVAYIFWTYPGLLLTRFYKEQIQDQYNDICQTWIDVTTKKKDDIDKYASAAFRKLHELTFDRKTTKKEWKKQLSREFWSYALGVDGIVRCMFPVLQFTTQAQINVNTRTELANSIILSHMNDHKGVCKEILSLLKGSEQ